MKHPDLRSDDGSATVFTVVLIPVLLLCAGLVLDGGGALAGKARAMGEADEAARAGADALNVAVYRSTGRQVLDVVRAEAAAKTFLAATGDQFTVTVAGDVVTVTVTHHQSTQLLDLAGIDTMSVTGTATARPVTTTPRTP